MRHKIVLLHAKTDISTVESTHPFLPPYGTPHETVPFDRIRFEDFEPALREGISREAEEVQRIATNAEPPTFGNTIEALDRSGALLECVSTVFFNLLSAETNDRMDELAQKISPVLSEHSNNIMLNAQLFARVKAVHDAPPSGLTAEQRMLLENTYEGFRRSGALLDETGKKRLRSITAELSRLTLQFSQNNLKETQAFVLHLTEEVQLSGLPELQKEQAAAAARERGLDGWAITLEAPSYVPFMTYADSRELRQRLYMAYNSKCTHDDAYNNFDNVRRIVDLRREKAQLLGYATYADYALKRRMAGTSDNVYRLLDELIEAYRPAAEAEVGAVEQKARRMEGDDFRLQAWDFAYYAHKLKLERYDLDAEMLRPYFELSRVKAGIFGLAHRLYGITLRENDRIPVYHPDVTAYEVFDADGSYLAVLYADFHPRAGKQNGAWETGYKSQWTEADGTDSRPQVSIVMNLTKPTATKPALLTPDEVETFLHEFGHALHAMFARTHYRTLSGTSVFWDFVEHPSQFMENYFTERDFLSTFAVHYETGEPLPDEYIDRIVKSRNFNAAYACMRQVSFGLLDMAYYTLDKPFEGDIRTFERKAWAKAQLLPPVDGTCMTVQFSHIMSGGYAAGYYSYKWAEVLDADAFSLFRQRGIFDRRTAQSFRDNILSRGGTEPPMDLYVRFRGRKPTIAALLTRNGIPVKKVQHDSNGTGEETA